MWNTRNDRWNQFTIKPSVRDYVTTLMATGQATAFKDQGIRRTATTSYKVDAVEGAEKNAKRVLSKDEIREVHSRHSMRIDVAVQVVHPVRGLLVWVLHSVHCVRPDR